MDTKAGVLTDELALALLQASAGRPSKFTPIRREAEHRIAKGEKNFTIPVPISSTTPEETKKDESNFKTNTHNWNADFSQAGIKFRIRYLPEKKAAIVVTQDLYEKVFGAHA